MAFVCRPDHLLGQRNRVAVSDLWEEMVCIQPSAYELWLAALCDEAFSRTAARVRTRSPAACRVA
jgi:hypothetical protein